MDGCFFFFFGVEEEPFQAMQDFVPWQCSVTLVIFVTIFPAVFKSLTNHLVLRWSLRIIELHEVRSCVRVSLSVILYFIHFKNSYYWSFLFKLFYLVHFDSSQVCAVYLWCLWEVKSDSLTVFAGFSYAPNWLKQCHTVYKWKPESLLKEQVTVLLATKKLFFF